MKTENYTSVSVSSTEMSWMVRHQPVEQSLFDIPKSRAILLYNEIEMVRRTTFICSSTCRKAEHVEQPNLAMKCPHFEGAVIYHARSFYNLIHPEQYNFFGDACDPVGAYKQGVTSNENVTKFDKFDVNIYPNPTGGLINLSCNHCDDNTEVIVYDILGKKVWHKLLKYASGETFIRFELAAGIYNITITNKSTSEHETKKLIVE